ncbi:MAG TPA: hypothetical protein VJH55_01805 [Candidatus Paceibacterota bacterium]
MDTETINPDEMDVTSSYDGHLHFREPGSQMDLILEHTIRRFCGATGMTNLLEPVTTTARGRWYKSEIERRVKLFNERNGTNWQFLPVITCYLTDRTDPKDLAQGILEGVFGAAKLMLTTEKKEGGTTNSHNAVVHIRNVYPAFDVLQTLGVPLLEHMEVPDENVDEFDREVIFIDRYQHKIIREFPDLKWVAEHISTKELCDLVRANRKNARGTVTIQHAKANRNALFKGGFHPEAWCKPILKREIHRQAVEDAMVGGEGLFGAGTDAALHDDRFKFIPCGKPGAYTANSSIEQYIEMFDRRGMIATAEGRRIARQFLCEVIPQFYRITVPHGVIRLTRKEQEPLERIEFDSGSVTPFPYRSRPAWTAMRIE